MKMTSIPYADHELLTEIFAQYEFLQDNPAHIGLYTTSLRKKGVISTALEATIDMRCACRMEKLQSDLRKVASVRTLKKIYSKVVYSELKANGLLPSQLIFAPIPSGRIF